MVGSLVCAGECATVVAYGATLPPCEWFTTCLREERELRNRMSAGDWRPLPQFPPELVEYINGAQNWTPLHRAADARDFDALSEYLRMGTADPKEEVELSHPDMRTALKKLRVLTRTRRHNQYASVVLRSFSCRVHW